MGDIAIALIEQGIDELILHETNQCDGMCRLCIEEGEEMTRLEQAMKWWHNQKLEIVPASTMPERHKKILRKHNKVTFFPGVAPITPHHYKLKVEND
jgi:hypothetical protein